MVAYRHDLDAATRRIDVLEARLAEKEAELRAREASVQARDAELYALQNELAASKPVSRWGAFGSRWGALASLGLAAMLVTVGLSEAFDRAERAELRYREAQQSLLTERRDNVRAGDSLRAELARLEGVIAQLEEHDLAEATDGGVTAPEAEPGSRKAELIARVQDGDADTNDLRLLRAICRSDGDEACRQWSLDRRRAERALGF